MPVPDKLKVSMLKPPPLPKVVKETYSKKIFGYITEAKWELYEQILETEKEGMSWSEAIRKGLSLFLEGNGKIQHKTMPHVDDFVAEVLAVLRYQQPTIPIQHRNLEEQAKYDQAREDAKKRQKVQKNVYKDIGKELVKEIKVRQDQENFGLIEREIPYSEILQTKLTPEELKKQAKEKTKENHGAYLSFQELKAKRIEEHKDDEWRVKLREQEAKA
jgi:hypothetical protein